MSYQLTDTRRPMGDFTTGVNNWRAESCGQFIDANAVRVSPPTPAPKVHEPPKGLL